MARSFWLVILLTCLAGLLADHPLWADDAGDKENGTAQATAKEKAGSDESTAEAGMYDVPTTTDPDVLLKYIHKLRDFQPTTAAEALTHRKKASKAAFVAADRIVSFCKDKQSEAYRFAFPIVAGRDLSVLYTKSPEAQAKAFEDVSAFVDGAKVIGMDEARLMATVTRALEMADNEELAAKAYSTFGEKLQSSGDPDLASLGQKFLGSVRRMKLVGQPMELTGTTFAGENFDLQSLKGKTVLVDFWATWCGPCRATIPQVREMYEAYHDKGFEVVGISLDDERKDLVDFMAEEKLPWIILHEKGEEQNEAALRYGISGIPAMFLVGADGNVISTHARGDELVRLLEEKFGPVPGKEKKVDDAGEEKKDKEDSEEK